MKSVWIIALLALAQVQAVKRHDFKTCSQSGFCTRQRANAQLVDLLSNGAEAPTPYTLVSSSINSEPTKGTLSASVSSSSGVLFALSVGVLEGGALRVQMREENPIGNLYQVATVVLENVELKSKPFKLVQSSSEYTAIAFNSTNVEHTLAIHHRPFRMDLSSRNTPIWTFNEHGYLHYEHQRLKDSPPPSDGSEPAAQSNDETLSEEEKTKKQLLEELKRDMWDESFSGKIDSKPKGPTSIGFDMNFPGFKHTYGLPQHASSYSLKPTRGSEAQYSEPYRLYNFDVFEYELDNPMALYGSVPFLMAHRKDYSVGVLWMNAAEMWVDVERKAGRGSSPALQMQDYVPFSTLSQTSATSTTTHWMAESGSIDVLVLLGPTPAAVSDQLTRFSGRPALPQLFAIGYHQCRWNYLDEQDVADVDANFDQFDIPYDVLWLDIEHTDGKRYFTWDKVKFPNPADMQNELAVKGRKMVTIIDPHLKQDDGYPVSKKAKDLGLLVKNSGGSDFDGWCWPGSSYWIDYLNPEGRKFWAEQFKYTNYQGSTPSLYTWNDMNEPSVFNGPEITMPKDNLHHGGFEHREVHNIYGALQHRATAEGHLVRSDNTDRPFVLSRAFFIGTQRYGAIWTGDNTATWDHLAVSVPMLLTIGGSGITFCGADVGGFFGNPDADLLVRWYQMAAFQPFFRAHAHIDTKRREPWLFGEPYTSTIREAVRRRYRILPYLYTLFWESNQNGAPVMRSLMHEFPEDENTFEIEDAFMLGSALLIHPVVAKETTSVSVYLPPSAVWYNYNTFARVSNSASHVQVETPLDEIPIFLKGGSILPRRDRVRRAAGLGIHDPYTLVIALDKAGSAKGKMYVDDGKSYRHETHGESIIADLEFQGGVLSSTSRAWFEKRGASGKTVTDQATVVEKLGNRVERLVILGMKASGVSSVVVKKAGETAGKRLEFSEEEVVLEGADEGSAKQTVVIVKDPKVLIGEEWSIVLS
ncbi:hypothetical protein HDU81_002349 [Chytriomyces hyalinus]|nr:hypothetical protein HDU81_002349 [Chytriomyces hyalinus]